MPSLPQEQQRGSWGSKTLSVTALDVMGEHEATTGWVVGAVESWDELLEGLGSGFAFATPAV